MFAATAVGSLARFSFLSLSSSRYGDGSASTPINPSAFFFCYSTLSVLKPPIFAAKSTNTQGLEQEKQGVSEDRKAAADISIKQSRKSADWKAASAYKDSGVVYEGRIEGFNNGGLLVRFYSLVGFLPYPLLCPDHSCKDPQRTIKEIAKDLVGSYISVKVLQVNEENNNLVFSEKDAIWSQFAGQVNIGDIFEGRVGSVEDYGAFVHLRFPDGTCNLYQCIPCHRFKSYTVPSKMKDESHHACGAGHYYLTGLVHISEVSWDLVQDVRDILTEGDDVKVKVIQVDSEKARVGLSIKQLEDDPLLETLDKVIPQAESDAQSASNKLITDPLPGLESICQELLKEDGITDVRIGRKGFEKRVVSQDLELWISNAPVEDKQFTLLARAGREVQEVHLTTNLDQEGVKVAVQRILARIP